MSTWIRLLNSTIRCCLRDRRYGRCQTFQRGSHNWHAGSGSGMLLNAYDARLPRSACKVEKGQLWRRAEQQLSSALTSATLTLGRDTPVLPYPTRRGELEAGDHASGFPVAVHNVPHHRLSQSPSCFARTSRDRSTRGERLCHCSKEQLVLNEQTPSC